MPSARKTHPTSNRIRMTARGAEVRSKRLMSGSAFRRELGEVVDTELLLDAGDAVDHFLEAVLPEELIFFLLEVLPESVVFVPADDLAQGREEDRVLPRLVGRVHADEPGHRVLQLAPPRRIAQRSGVGEPYRGLRQLAARLVLLEKNVHQVDEPSGLAEAGKQEVLLQLLVVVLDEAADEPRGIRHRLGRQVLS